MTAKSTVTPKARRKSSCPEGWIPVGARVPLRVTVQQTKYCRQALGISRFCYNLAVSTHRFHLVNRLRWPSWQDIYKAFNACKKEDYPFVKEVSNRVVEGAFMDFGKAVANWRNPKLGTRAPRLKRRKLTGVGSFRASSGVNQIRYDGKWRVKLDCKTRKMAHYHRKETRPALSHPPGQGRSATTKTVDHASVRCRSGRLPHRDSPPFCKVLVDCRNWVGSAKWGKVARQASVAGGGKRYPYGKPLKTHPGCHRSDYPQAVERQQS